MSRAPISWALALVCLGGCTSQVFNHPVSISTKSDAVHVARRIQPVRVERCDTLIVVVPILYDPANMYDALLSEARKAGGNAVVDLQIRGTSATMVFPFVTRSCAAATGTAAVID